jgi:Uri superfamily endonuclease
MDKTYILEIWLEREKAIRIGKLGKFHFPRGYYLYVGSAKKNLRQRIQRHLREEKNRFWHIDYLLPYGSINGVWTGEVEEEDVAEILEQRLKIPVQEFGSSDTQRNRAHLFKGDVDKGFLEGISFKRWR